MPNPTQHSLPEVLDATVELIAKALFAAQPRYVENPSAWLHNWDAAVANGGHHRWLNLARTVFLASILQAAAPALRSQHYTDLKEALFSDEALQAGVEASATELLRDEVWSVLAAIWNRATGRRLGLASSRWSPVRLTRPRGRLKSDFEPPSPPSPTPPLRRPGGRASGVHSPAALQGILGGAAEREEEVADTPIPPPEATNPRIDDTPEHRYVQQRVGTGQKTVPMPDTPEEKCEDDWPPSVELMSTDGLIEVMPSVLEGRTSDLEGRRFTTRRYIPAPDCHGTGTKGEGRGATESERVRLEDALRLLAITHFDHERLINDERFDCTDLFEAGLVKHHEIGQSGEYDCHLTVEGMEAIQEALGFPLGATGTKPGEGER